jgi:hypothetical protein
MKLLDYILARAKEPSTYKGALALAAALGLKLDPEQSTAIVSAILAALGVWEVFRREKK